jgi:PAS domain-containing protein
MKSICAWCKKELSADSGQPAHGMCAACRDIFFPSQGQPSFRRHLDRLAVPLLVVDDDARVLIANKQARLIFGKTPEEIEGKLYGMAVDCSNAHLLGRCGRTVHCRECSIRHVVADTYATGRSHSNVPVCLDTTSSQGRSKLRFLISSEKAGEVVLLRLTAV